MQGFVIVDFSNADPPPNGEIHSGSGYAPHGLEEVRIGQVRNSPLNHYCRSYQIVFRPLSSTGVLLSRQGRVRRQQHMVHNVHPEQGKFHSIFTWYIRDANNNSTNREKRKPCCRRLGEFNAVRGMKSGKDQRGKRAVGSNEWWTLLGSFKGSGYSRCGLFRCAVASRLNG